jgi:ATP-dependent Clp protease ATP-binding subunit ClpA
MPEFEFPLPGLERNALEAYTRDLTDAALREELEPVRCRDREIERVIAILLRQSKNNPVLVGDAGVGKTAIAEGLAQRIVSGRVPESLARARLLMLSHIDLIAGTTFRGQFEKRLQGVIDQAARDPRVILFVDELHNLIGQGSAMGQPLDAANMLKPALSRGALRVIGATTRNEYDMYIRPDAALERRFHPVDVAELNREQTMEVLQARRPRLEMHHVLAITDAALARAFDLSEGRGANSASPLSDGSPRSSAGDLAVPRAPWYSQRKHPDKEIDLLDEACALERLRRGKALPSRLARLVEERSRLLAVEEEALDAILRLAQVHGNALERFSTGTYRAFEAIGVGLERLLTGQTTPRPALPRPESLRRLEESDPAGRLRDAHRRRTRLEGRIRQAAISAGLVIDGTEVERAAGVPVS